MLKRGDKTHLHTYTHTTQQTTKDAHVRINVCIWMHTRLIQIHKQYTQLHKYTHLNTHTHIMIYIRNTSWVQRTIYTQHMHATEGRTFAHSNGTTWFLGYALPGTTYSLRAREGPYVTEMEPPLPVTLPACMNQCNNATETPKCTQEKHKRTTYNHRG